MTIPLIKHIKKLPKVKKNHVLRVAKSSMWFLLGAIIGFFFFVSFLYVTYKKMHEHVIYEGVLINGIDFGGKTQQDVKTYFAQKNKFIKNVAVTIQDKNVMATISAKQIEFGYDENLLAQQAYSLGRSGD